MTARGAEGLRVLWVATKPPLPPRDGGRLLQKLTLEALAERGVRLTLVAPMASEWAGDHGEQLGARITLELVTAAPRARGSALLRSLLGRTAWSIARHTSSRVRRRVERLLERQRFDLVHVEQLQAWSQVAPRGRLPRLLRTQNVESDLWAAWAGSLRGWRRRWALAEARRLRLWEARALDDADGVVALTAEDAARLGALAGSARIETIVAPFPARLPAAEEPLSGRPSVVLFGSAGWLPNRRATEGFLEEVWPAVQRRWSDARLHLFGDCGAPPRGSVIGHPSPGDSRDAFAPGSILAVPLQIASGVRMKILEAWARGVPVVASPEAASGLAAENGRELLLAPDAASWLAAIRALVEERELAPRLAQAGRRLLAERHDPAKVAERWIGCYEDLVDRAAARVAG